MQFGFVPKKISVSLSFQDILISVLKYITVDGRPFEIVNDAGFKHLVDPILRALPGPKKTMSRQKARQFVQDVASELRKLMTQIFIEYGKLLSVSLDGGAYHGRKFLGIKVQCRDLNDISQFKSYVIGTVELEHASTGSHLKKKMLQELEVFDIYLENLISITTDGGKNYKRIAKVINQRKKMKETRESGSIDDEENEFESEQESLDSDTDELEQKLRNNEDSQIIDDDDWTLEDVYVAMNEEEEDELYLKFQIERLLKLSMEDVKYDLSKVLGL